MFTVLLDGTIKTDNPDEALRVSRMLQADRDRRESAVRKSVGDINEAAGDQAVNSLDAMTTDEAWIKFKTDLPPDQRDVLRVVKAGPMPDEQVRRQLGVPDNSLLGARMSAVAKRCKRTGRELLVHNRIFQKCVRAWDHVAGNICQRYR